MVKYIGTENELTAFVRRDDKFIVLAAIGGSILSRATFEKAGANHLLLSIPTIEEANRRAQAGNAWLANGGRLYFDGTLLEYASPECISVRDGTLSELAGEKIVISLGRALGEGENFYILKRSAPPDMWKKKTQGSHENYALPLEFFREIVFGKGAETRHAAFKKYIASRQLFAGAGHIGYFRKENSEPFLAFWISPRARFIDCEVSYSTRMGQRGLINTRENETHMRGNLDGMARLHMIAGDMNRSPWSIYLKLGVTAIVLEFLQFATLSCVEDLLKRGGGANSLVDRAKAVSFCLNTKNKTEAFRDFLAFQYFLSDEIWNVASRIRETVAEFNTIFNLWREALDAVAGHESARRVFSRRLDWMIRRRWIEEISERELCDLRKIEQGELWNKLLSLDFNYSRIGEADFYQALTRAGKVEEMFDVSERDKFVAAPPPGRAAARVGLVRLAGELGISEHITELNWGLVSFGRDVVCPSAQVVPERKIEIDDRGLEALKLYLEEINAWIKER